MNEVARHDADIDKLNSDLDTVFEKINLLKDMIGSGISMNDGLSELVGFLEACRDRMPALVNAGSEGKLNEELFEKCLVANDLVQRALNAEKNGTEVPTYGSLTQGADNGGDMSNKSIDGDLLDLSPGAAMSMPVNAKNKKKGNAPSPAPVTQQVPLLAKPPSDTANSNLNSSTLGIDLLSMNDGNTATANSTSHGQQDDKPIEDFDDFLASLDNKE